METKIEEIWKPVPGIEKYHVSNLGRVKNIRTGRIINSQNSKGYKQLAIYSSGTNLVHKHLVHRMVLMAFVPNPENKPFVNHKNGIKNDNKLSNLEWCTAQENSDHAKIMGLNNPPYGERSHHSKLITSQVIEIRKAISMGISVTIIAKKYNIHPATVSKIRLRKRWGHLL